MEPINYHALSTDEICAHVRVRVANFRAELRREGNFFADRAVPKEVKVGYFTDFAKQEVFINNIVELVLANKQFEMRPLADTQKKVHMLSTGAIRELCLWLGIFRDKLGIASNNQPVPNWMICQSLISNL